jgi:uncharacterized protein (TIGR02145 family)
MGKDGNVKGGTMKVALLNLGQSADWTLEGGYVPNNDAGDLGDFYQWGRVADGHQNVVWSKNANHQNQILPFGETPANTADSISYKIPAYPSYNTADHQVAAGDPHYGKFINAGTVSSAQGGDNDWYNSNNGTAIASHDNSLWGDGTKSSSTRASDILLSGWTYPSNNPCPAGWRVPSRWNWWDLYKGTGTDTSIAYSNYDGTDNTWQWRDSNGASSTAVGGVIITNDVGEKLFLPLGCNRAKDNSRLTDNNINTHGFYWSSTVSLSSFSYYAYGVQINKSSVNAGIFSSNRADGQSVRPVAEF